MLLTRIFFDKLPGHIDVPKMSWKVRCTPEIGRNAAINATRPSPMQSYSPAKPERRCLRQLLRHDAGPSPPRREKNSSLQRRAEVSWASRATDTFDLLLQCDLLKRCERKRKEETDSPVEHDKCVTKCAFDIVRRPFYCCRVSYAPMRSHRLSRPEGTRLIGRVAANRENKVHAWRVGRCELVPGFAA